MNTVNFPGLGIQLNIDPVAFHIGSKPVYWYGIIIAFGLFSAIIYCYYEGRRVGLHDDTVIDVALFATPAAIIGARAYYVIFKFSDYAANPVSVFYIWEGGMAIYGAIIAAVITAYIYCRVKKVNWKAFFDVGSMGLLIGQAIGRWGNFINAEAYGGATAVPWRMEVYDNVARQLISVHPTFFYESLWNVIGFFALFIYRKHKKFDGEIFLLYITWYGLGRMWVEQMRSDSLMIFGVFKVSQLLAAACVIIGTLLLIKNYKEAKNEKNSIIDSTNG